MKANRLLKMLSSTRKICRFACGSVLHDLKLNGLLRFRGCRAGRRKIPERISDRMSYTTCRERTTSRTSVLIPIVPEQRFRVGSYLKFCSLNARSVRNKSADLISYVESSGTDIIAVTKFITARPLVPWFSDDIRETRRERRRAERKWRRSRSVRDLLELKKKRNLLFREKENH